MPNDTELLDYIEKTKRDIRFVPYDAADSEMDLWVVGNTSSPKLREAIALDMPNENRD